jgi:hypothetical protein
MRTCTHISIWMLLLCTAPFQHASNRNQSIEDWGWRHLNPMTNLSVSNVCVIPILSFSVCRVWYSNPMVNPLTLCVILTPWQTYLFRIYVCDFYPPCLLCVCVIVGRAEPSAAGGASAVPDLCGGVSCAWLRVVLHDLCLSGQLPGPCLKWVSLGCRFRLRVRRFKIPSARHAMTDHRTLIEL